MKESIGSTQLFIIVIFLIVLFSGIIALTMNHSNAFAIKSQIVDVIEKNGGFDTLKSLDSGASYEPLEEIVSYLTNSSYRQKGPCSGSAVGYDRSGIFSSIGSSASFCIEKIAYVNNSSTGLPPTYIYRVTVFYGLDIPVIRQWIPLKVVGETKPLYN